MQNVNKIIFLFSMAFMILLCLSSVSAVDINDNNLSSTAGGDGNCFSLNDLGENAIGDNCIVSSDSSSNGDLIIPQSESDDDFLNENFKNLNEDSKNALKENRRSSIYHIDSDNFQSYFVDGVLNDEFNNSIIIFSGEFIDKGILEFKSSNLTLIGNNSLFNNTAFCLSCDNIMLAGLNFVLDREFKDNDYAGILVLGNNCSIYNCTMNYTVPQSTNGFCLYTQGGDDKIQNFTLVNNSFNFYGNNLYGGWDYGIFIDSTDNAMIYGNNINCSLPLRAVSYVEGVFGGVSMDSVGAFVSQMSNNMTLSNNNISSYVTEGGTYYPTLDTLLIYGCNSVVIENNSIYSEDFDSADGKDNYLQGIDLYFSYDVMILNNQIHIRTTGGCGGMGTAYPIQVAGPVHNVTIAFNNLSTVNFGPNCGIYSMNYFGPSSLYIISNFINVSGVATWDSWALVTGIEVQDSDDRIWNNTIIVNNMGNYNDYLHVYGISYDQNTFGNHTYNIQYNNVTTNGYYAVSLVGRDSLVVNSIVANNILNAHKTTGNKAVRIGKGENNVIRNNTNGIFKNNFTDDYYPDWLKDYESLIPVLVVPKYYDENSNGSGLNVSKSNGSAPFKNKGSAGGFNNGKSSLNDKSPISGNGTNHHSDSVIGSIHDTAPGIGGSSTPSISASSPGDSGSSAADPKAYNIEEKENSVKSSNHIQLAIICIAFLLLLIGYKRQKNRKEE